MQHSNISTRHDIYQLTRLNMPDLNEVWLKCQDIRIAERKSRRVAFPSDLPVLTCSPAVPIDEEREVRVIEQELAVQTLDVDRLDVFSPRNKI